jgi:hypothetical protein
LLVESGRDGESVGRIGETLKVPGATLSFHLKELARSGLVRSRQERQFFYYSVDFERMAELMTFLTQNCCQGMPQACLTVVETELSRCCAAKRQPKRARKGSLNRVKPSMAARKKNLTQSAARHDAR